MRAIVQERFGPPSVLELRDVPVPTIGDDGVLVRVRAAGVNALDWRSVRGEPLLARLMPGGFGVRRPSAPIPGIDCAGTVEAVGAAVTELLPGDEVFGAGSGTFAEFVATRVRSLVPKPSNLSFEAAAAIPTAGTTALQAVRERAAIKPGERVLVRGASGGVGTFVVQLAKAAGAHVTAVTGTGSVEFVRSLGADEVIARGGAEPGGFDAIIEVSAERPLRAVARQLRPGGRLVVIGAAKGRIAGPILPLLAAPLLSRLTRIPITVFIAAHSRERLLALAGMAASGALVPHVVEALPLASAADALGRLERHEVRGKLVLTL